MYMSLKNQMLSCMIISYKKDMSMRQCP